MAAVSLTTAVAVAGCGNGDRSYSCPDCNILLISADTLRADHVGAWGYDRDTTPNIDGLAARGVVFENAISQSSWTRPAHMSMFTGLYPSEHGFVALIDRKRLDPSVPTLAEVLAEHGYTTAAFTGGVNMSAAFGFDRGFQTFRSNGKYFRDNLEDTKYWLEEHAREKFFLVFHGYDAHTPYLTDPVDRLALGLSDRAPRKGLRRICKSKAGQRYLRRYIDEYDGGIHRGDRYVGKLLDYLQGLGVLANTVVVFTSDHGEEFMEHGGCFHLNTVFSEVLHVPLLIVAPGLTPRRVGDLVPASVSIAPTILEIAGVTDHPLPGPSLVQAALGGRSPKGSVISETSRTMSHPRGRGHVRALTTESDKLIQWITQQRYDHFDLRRDPGETRPLGLSGRQQALRIRLEDWLERHPRRGAGEDEPGEQEKIPDDEQRRLQEELRSLGYMN